jgi:hypothetical protein
VQQPQPLARQISGGEDHPCDVSAGLAEARDQTIADRVAAAQEDDRRRRGCGLRHQRRCGVCDDQGHPTADEIGHQTRQPVALIVRPAIFDGDVPALDKPGIAQTLLKRADKMREAGCPSVAKEADHRHRRLLRARRGRPRN